MQRYFIRLSYNGTSYKGWQVQPDAATIQGVINDAFSTFLKERIVVTGAGRTDTGVHASFFMAHFDSSSNDLDEDFVFRINGFLPDDIAISKLIKVDNESHSRFHAISRTYEYHITRVKNPFFLDQAFYVYGNINVDAMNRAANMLFEYDDFTSFCKSNTATKTMICKIMHSQFDVRGDMLIYTIKADRFLRNMVRAIVGTLILVGIKDIEPERMREIIEIKDRSAAGFSAPAKGLFLTNIEYPARIENML